jgi:hypothetical protein
MDESIMVSACGLLSIRCLEAIAVALWVRNACLLLCACACASACSCMRA